MAIEVVTRQDLQEFRLQLLDDIKQMLQVPSKTEVRWLKGAEVRKLLRVSASTLQRLRVQGVLKSSRVGGVLYYRYEDILRVLENGVSRE